MGAAPAQQGGAQGSEWHIRGRWPMGPQVRPLTPVRPSAACGNRPMCKPQTILNYIIYREKNFGRGSGADPLDRWRPGKLPRHIRGGGGVHAPQTPLPAPRPFLGPQRTPICCAARTRHLWNVFGYPAGLPGLSGGSEQDPPAGQWWADIGQIRKSGQFFLAL